MGGAIFCLVDFSLLCAAAAKWKQWPARRRASDFCDNGRFPVHYKYIGAVKWFCCCARVPIWAIREGFRVESAARLGYDMCFPVRARGLLVIASFLWLRGTADVSCREEGIGYDFLVRVYACMEETRIIGV